MNKFVFLDHVQFSRRSFQNRNLIKSSKGAIWLTIPIKKTRRETIIKNIEISYITNWIDKHLSIIHESYKNSNYYKQVMPIIETLYNKKYSNLCDFNINVLKVLIQKMNYSCSLSRSSDFKFQSKKSDLILEICKNYNCTNYVTGIGSKSYLDEIKFIKNNIEIEFVEPQKYIYKQQFEKKGFLANLSIIDYIFNMGFKKII